MKKGIVLGLSLFLALLASAVHADHQWNEAYGVYYSSHPYYPNNVERIRIHHPGASYMRVHFTRLETERGYDVVEVVDNAGRRVNQFSGSYSDVWSEAVQGDTIWVVLKSDRSQQAYGFDIDRYAYVAEFLPPAPPIPPVPPVPPVPPTPPVPPVPSREFISVDGFLNHDIENRTISFHGRVLGFYPRNGTVRISTPDGMQALVGLTTNGDSFSTEMITLPEGMVTTVEIILQSTDGRRFSTSGYARARNPGYRGFTETIRVR